MTKINKIIRLPKMLYIYATLYVKNECIFDGYTIFSNRKVIFVPEESFIFERFIFVNAIYHINISVANHSIHSYHFNATANNRVYIISCIY